MLIHRVLIISLMLTACSSVSNADSSVLIERVLKASLSKTFEEKRDGWVAIGEISELKIKESRINSYMILVDYDIGEGNHTYLIELISKERNGIRDLLRSKKEKKPACKKEYKDICLAKDDRDRYINNILANISAEN